MQIAPSGDVRCVAPPGVAFGTYGALRITSNTPLGSASFTLGDIILDPGRVRIQPFAGQVVLHRLYQQAVEFLGGSTIPQVVRRELAVKLPRLRIEFQLPGRE